MEFELKGNTPSFACKYCKAKTKELRHDENGEPFIVCSMISECHRIQEAIREHRRVELAEIAENERNVLLSAAERAGFVRVRKGKANRKDLEKFDRLWAIIGDTLMEQAAEITEQFTGPGETGNEPAE